MGAVNYNSIVEETITVSVSLQRLCALFKIKCNRPFVRETTGLGSAVKEAAEWEIYAERKRDGLHCYGYPVGL